LYNVQGELKRQGVNKPWQLLEEKSGDVKEFMGLNK
jgi:hypothetical protein